MSHESAEARAPYATDGDDPDHFFLSLGKIMGKQVADISVTVSREFHEASLVLFRVVFEDGTFLNCEGEHDFPYLTHGYGDKGVMIPDIEHLAERPDDEEGT